MIAFLLTYRDVLLWTALLTIVFYAIEHWIPAEASQRFADRRVNWLYAPVIVAWVLALQAILTPWYLFVIELARGGLFAPLIRARTNLAAELLLSILFAVLWDVWQYAIHRMQHTWPVLWETHKFHHSDAALNASAQARHHALSYVLYLAGYAPMLLLFGAFAPHFAISFLMFRVWGFVNHANVRISFGPLTGWIAGPQWHRVHHSIHPHHFNTNFAALFPFIDRLFGTYYAPARDEYPPTGLPSTTETQLQQATISPLMAWYGAARRCVRRGRALAPIETRS